MNYIMQLNEICAEISTYNLINKVDWYMEGTPPGKIEFTAYIDKCINSKFINDIRVKISSDDSHILSILYLDDYLDTAVNEILDDIAQQCIEDSVVPDYDDFDKRIGRYEHVVAFNPSTTSSQYIISSANPNSYVSSYVTKMKVKDKYLRIYIYRR